MTLQRRRTPAGEHPDDLDEFAVDGQRPVHGRGNAQDVRQLFPINPLTVSRYQDRYSISRAKSDPGDAVVLPGTAAAMSSGMHYQAVSTRRSSSGADGTAAMPTTAVEAHRASL